METINGLSQENSEKERIIKDLDENGYLIKRPRGESESKMGLKTDR